MYPEEPRNGKPGEHGGTPKLENVYELISIVTGM